MSTSTMALLKERRFLPFFITQFFGAFNDNAFKLSMLTLISYHLSHSQAQSEYYQALAGVLFIFPFFIFSATAGQLADQYDKSLLTRLVKIFEIVLMLLGGIAFYQNNVLWMMVTLTGMGIHSAFFGPIKYSILPDHLRKEELLAATGFIEASTFLAILFGTTLGTLSIGSDNATPILAVTINLGAAFFGLLSSLFIPDAPAAIQCVSINLNPWRATLSMLKLAKKETDVSLIILTLSWFWLISAVLLTKLPDYTHYILAANTSVFAVFLALFSIGIAIGSLVVNRLLHGRISLVGVPLAMLAFTGFILDLYWASPTNVPTGQALLSLAVFFSNLNHWRIAFDLFMLAFSAGLFVVPLYTYLQIASPAETRARTIAANNIYNALFMVLGSLLVMILLHYHISIPQVFFILSLLNGIAALCLWRRLRHHQLPVAH